MKKELITAFVDNELRDESLKNEITHLIKTDDEFKAEYQLQLMVKKLVKEKYKRTAAPDYLRNRILDQIAPKQVRDAKTKAESFWAGLFSKPAYSFAIAIIIIVSVILIILNRTVEQQPPVISLEKLTPDNMFYQAQNNFQAIIEGKLTPQLIADKPDEIQKFFEMKGVKYSTLVPTFAQWSILGAVVSEDKGEKFAHHVYIGKKGELVYVFQVDESYLQSHEIISLDEKLLQYLDSGKCYLSSDGKRTILFKKINHNICAVVSNAPESDLQNNFCNI